MKPILTLTFGLLVLCTAYGQSTPKHCCELDTTKTKTLKNLGAEFQKLKKADRHCCDNFGSGLYSVMHILEDSLRLSSLDESSLIGFMGKPDEEITQSNKRYDLKKGEKLLLYHWRGRHDYMILRIDNSILREVSWYYALD